MKTKILLGLSIVYLLASVGCKKEPAKVPAQAPKPVVPVPPVPPVPGKTAQVLTLEHSDADGTVIPGLDESMSQGDVSVGTLKGFATGAAIIATSSDDTKATVAIDPATGAITVKAIETNDNTDVNVVLTFSSPEFENFAAASISHTITILAIVTPPNPVITESTFTASYDETNKVPLLTMTSGALKAGTEKVLVVVYEPVGTDKKLKGTDIKFWGAISATTISNLKGGTSSELSYIADQKTGNPQKLKLGTRYSIAVYSVGNTAVSFKDKASAASFVQNNRGVTLATGVLQKQIISYTK